MRNLKPFIRVFLFVLAMSLVASGCFRLRCNSDPDHYLLFDTLTLIDDYYIEPVDRKSLLFEGMKGVAIELALRQIEAEKEKKKADAGDEPTPQGQDAKPQIEDKENQQEATPGDQEALDKDKEDDEVDVIRIDIDDLLKRAPFQIVQGDLAITLTAGGKSIDLAFPVEKTELIEGFFQALNFVRDEVGISATDEDVFFAGINGMVNSLDPHSSFLPPKICGLLKAETSGSFAGVGIEIGIRRNRLTVISPISGTPAFRAGLKPLDVISAVDGKPSLGMSLMEAVELIRGKIGTTVVLTILRQGKDDPFDVELVREKIDERSIKAELLPGRIGYVRIFKFNEKTKNDLNVSFDEMIKEAGSLRGLIIDMRFNPGGLLDQAVLVADKFLDSGMIVNTMGRGMFVDRRRFASGRNTVRDLPLLVLQNLHSASGAEIVAGALQDHQRALLVGTRSFGKGSVQSIFKLPASSCLRLTTALYYTPSGRSIQATGIVPDIAFVYPQEEQELMSAYSEKALKNHLTTTKSEKNSKAAITFDVDDIFSHYKATNQVVMDPDFPEKADWLLHFAKQIMTASDLSKEGMLERGRELLAKVPKAQPTPAVVSEAPDQAPLPIQP